MVELLDIAETAEDLRAKASEAKAALRSAFGGSLSLRWSRAAAQRAAATGGGSTTGAARSAQDARQPAAGAGVAGGGAAHTAARPGASPLKGAVGAMRQRAEAVLGEYKNAAVSAWEGLDALPWAVADSYNVLERSVIRCGRNAT